jgi:cullin-4
MKARKTVEHKDLVMATIDAVKAHFAPDVRTIKERVEQLIEQEYMRRDAERENVYVYVA